MNFLGHIYFSNNDSQLMYANLLGDYVKGSDYSHYPQKIREGIKLHRTIDNYIDHHPVVLELLHQLYAHLPKVSGIAVDLYFDHLLAKNWNSFHPTDLRTFTQHFYATTIEHVDYYEEDCLVMLKMMKKYDWLYQYRLKEGLTLACQGLSQRISFENSLADAPQIYDKYEAEIENAFHLFMADAIPFYKDYFEKN